MVEPSEPTEHDDSGHLPVLAAQVLAYLDPKPGQVFLDCTVGRGGHGELVIPQLGPGGVYVGLDMDGGNAAFSQERLGPVAAKAGVRLEVTQANFREARAVLERLGIARTMRGESSVSGPHPGPLPRGEGGKTESFPGGAGIDCLLADLGFASNQMDDPERGMSFSEDGPLDMRLNPDAEVTAERLVNTLSEKELADLIYEFGEERLSRRIARKIVEQRQIEPITTTSGLAELVRRAYPRPQTSNRSSKKPKGRSGVHRIHPATRTFMALRIAVNDELGSLDELLESLPGLLKPGGRAAVISFHSLEDRRVKQAFQALRQEQGYELLTRKPVAADEEETRVNPRSRSAKMRVVEKRIK